MLLGVLVVDPVDVCGVDDEVGPRGLGEENCTVVGAGTREVTAPHENAVTKVPLYLAASAVDVAVGIGAEGCYEV